MANSPSTRASSPKNCHHKKGFLLLLVECFVGTLPAYIASVKNATKETKQKSLDADKTMSPDDAFLLLLDEVKLLRRENENRVKENEILAKENATLRSELTARDEQIDQLRIQIEWLRRQIFGRKSERFENPNQLQLLLEFHNDDQPQEDPSAEPAKQKVTSLRRLHNRPIAKAEDYSHLPVKEHRIIVPDEVKEKPDDYELCEGAEEVAIEVKCTPPVYFIRKTTRLKYVKKKRSRDAAADAPVVAPAPVRIFGKSPISTDLASYIAIQKYQFHLPLYRQEQKLLQESGIRFPRQTLCDAIGTLTQALLPIYNAMHDELLESDYLQMDETVVKYFDENGHVKRGFIWLVNDPRKNVLLIWNLRRNHALIENALNKGDRHFQGTLQTDGHSAYITFVRENPGVTHLYCWAHFRRYVFNARVEAATQTDEILALIRQLYTIERDRDESDELARQQNWPPGTPLPTPEEKSLFEKTLQNHRLKQRETLSPPILEKLRLCMQAWKENALTKSKRGEAVTYYENHKSGLEDIFKRGDVFLDNNSVERAVRPCALGRKNWLFIGAPDAGNRAAVIYSLIMTARRFGHNPEHYLKSVLQKLEEDPIVVNALIAENYTNPFLRALARTLTPAHWNPQPEETAE